MCQPASRTALHRGGYLISEYHEPAAACGVRYDDPAFAISWPLASTEISAKDQAWPAFAGMSA
jgi:dTDP-4-dehydrorhamnose 3,5-epimerase